MFVSWIMKSLFLDFFFFLIGLRHPYPVMKYSEDQKYSVMKNKKKENRKKERKNCSEDQMGSVMKNTPKKKKWKRKKKKQKRGE